MAADLALKVAKARLLFDLDIDRLLMIAKETVEDGGERLALETIAT